MKGDAGTIYAGSDGRFYTAWQVDRRLQRGEWKLCLHDRHADKWLVDTPEEVLLALVPIDPSDLPEWVRIRSDRAGRRIVDTRRTVPI